MEGKHESSGPNLLLQKLRDFTCSIVEDLSHGRSPVIYIHRFRNYCTDISGNCYCSHDSVKGVEILTLQRECHARRLVMGWLRFSEADRIFNCLNHPDTAHSIPVHVEEVKDIISVADYILVVEKESVFQRLANDCFCKTNRSIVITGRGYPDIQTRRFLRLLIEQLRLPAYCLVDCDPYGFDILTTYRFGSMQMAYDTKTMRLPEIQWLGVFPSDAERYSVPQQCLLPMTSEDRIKTEAILSRCYLQRVVPEWRVELQLLLQSGVKFEIEALSVHSLTFLSKEYIPTKIQGRSILTSTL